MNERPWQRPLRLALCFLVLFAHSALADSLPSSESLKQTLATQNLTIEGYGLDEDGLNAFYATRDYRPAWNFAGYENSAAFATFLDSIDQQITWHGLWSEDYALDAMRQRAAANDDASRLDLELLVTDTLLRLAHDLHGDDIDLGQLYPGWNFHRAEADIPVQLAQAVAASSAGEFFDSLTPKNQAYRDLGHALRIYRDLAAKGGWPLVEPGPSLRPKDHGPRVVQLRARLAGEGYLPSEPLPGKTANIFDENLREAVEAYQFRNGLEADGQVGVGTLAALDVPIEVHIDQIRANMERWRHMPEDFPPPRGIIVNIADASIDIFDEKNPVYRGPVIVGQVERKTPFIQSVIRSMIINPSWHVPSSIARADILPKLRQDPHYLEKLGFVIRDSEADPYGTGIDWKNLRDEEFNFRLRQQPGKMNSLGRLKFDFDNDFAVYLHGTPHQELFQKNARTLSSGCVRLRDPELVAELVLAGTPGEWNVPHIEDAIATRKTHWIGLKQPMPVAILYWTVFADEAGQIQFRNDVYDYDRSLIENLRPGAETVEPETKTGVNP